MANENPTDDEDDPWADVASEDELMQRAQSDGADGDSSEDPNEDDAGDGVDSLGEFEETTDDGGEDAESDDLPSRKDIQERAAEAVADAARAADGPAEVPEAVETLADNVEARISGVYSMDDEERRSYLNAIETLEERAVELLESAEDTTDTAPSPTPVPDDYPDDFPEDDTDEDDPEPSIPPTQPDRPDAEGLDYVADANEFESSVPEGMEIISDNVSCANCEHRQVCVILSSFAPQLADENWDAGLEDEGSPIDPMDLAKVCDSYAPEEGEDAPKQAVSDDA
jgi:hypothetical protein